VKGESEASRQLATLERLLAMPTTDLETTLSTAADLVADTMSADKVDAFLYEPHRDSLFALGTSHQPLSATQKEHGLDLLQLANGGRVVDVFRTGKPFVAGNLMDDPDELAGVKTVLRIQSKCGIPLVVGGETRGVLMIASQEPDFWNEEDVRYAQAVAKWIGVVIHRAELVQEIARNATEQGRRAAADELVTVLAHDFRNHLAPIHLRLAIVQRSALAEGRAEDAEHLSKSLKGLERLGALVGDILDVARLDRGMFHIDPQPVDIVSLLEECTESMQSPEQHVNVKVRARGKIIVSGDAGRLRQVFENVLANALKHSPRNAPVTVQVGEAAIDEGERVRIEVIDEGPGVAADVLPRIFDRFVSGETSTGGLGLGLYLAHRIAALHQGELTVENLPGKGARFLLTLPCRVAKPDEQLESPPPCAS
jgi:two-component system, OmpR family, sensor kinase